MICVETLIKNSNALRHSAVFFDESLKKDVGIFGRHLRNVLHKNCGDPDLRQDFKMRINTDLSRD